MTGQGAMHTPVLLNLILMMVVVLKVPQRPATAVKPGSHMRMSGFQETCDCECAASRTVQRGKIVGGLETQPHEFPWLAAIFVNKKMYCGGTIVTERHILTAAHCLDKKPSQYLILLGAHNLHDEEGEAFRVSQIIIHGYYNPHHHDIGLMKLATRIGFSDIVRAGCLPQIWRENYVGEMGVVTGWGKVGESSGTSSTVQKVGVPIISFQECSRYYSPREISQRMICAGYAEGKRDACQGDSGGPLHIVNEFGYLEVIGIVSFGRGCARPNTPGVYTKISDYMNWINHWVDQECVCSPPIISYREYYY